MSEETTDLCSLEEIIEYGKLSDKNEQDNDYIENTINRMSKYFATMCNRDQFLAKSYTEYYDGNGDVFLFPLVRPIISVISIHDSSDWTWNSDSLISSSDYAIQNSNWIVMKDDVFSMGNRNIRLIYRAGYASIPDDLKQACIEEVLRRFRRRSDFDVTAKTIEDGTVTYTEKDLLAQTRRVLNKYTLKGIR